MKVSRSLRLEGVLRLWNNLFTIPRKCFLISFVDNIFDIEHGNMDEKLKRKLKKKQTK